SEHANYKRQRFAKHMPDRKSCQTGTRRPRSLYNRHMLFMVIAHFRNTDPRPIRERFLREGRMLSEAVVYHASWVDPERARCYQLMEAPALETIQLWTKGWADLVE